MKLWFLLLSVLAHGCAPMSENDDFDPGARATDALALSTRQPAYHTLLSLDGEPAGVSRVALEPVWNGESYGPLVLEFSVATSLTPPIVDWLRSHLEGIQESGGELEYVDADYKVRRRTSFRGGIKSFTLSALDAGRPAAGILAVEVAVSACRAESASGQNATTPPAAHRALSFRLEVNGRNVPVIGTKPLTMQMPLARRLDPDPPPVTFGMRLRPSEAAYWEALFHDYAIRGHREVTDELTGSLTFLDVMERPVFVIDLEQLSWRKVASDEDETLVVFNVDALDLELYD